LDRGGMKLIGEVFRQCEEAESFYAGSVQTPQVAILCPHQPQLSEESTVESEEGAVLLCHEAHYDYAIVNDQSDLSCFELVMLPDELILSEQLREKLQAYHAGGGRILSSFRAGLRGLPEDPAGLSFLPARWEGRATRFPNYWRQREGFSYASGEDDRVVYLRGANVKAAPDAQVWLDRVLPYFQRTDLQFTSHFQAPPLPDPCTHPALVAGDRCAYFADPIFRECRRSASLAVRDAWREVMRRLIGPSPFGRGLKSTVRLYPRKKGRDLLLTLLHYIPKRKAHELDVIDERMGFAGQRLCLPTSVRSVLVYPSGSPLEFIGAGEWMLPALPEGRLMLVVPDFYP